MFVRFHTKNNFSIVQTLCFHRNISNLGGLNIFNSSTVRFCSRMTSADDLKRIACDVIDSERPKLLEINREIWENPELAYQELKASKLLAGYLKLHGFQVGSLFSFDKGYFCTLYRFYCIRLYNVLDKQSHIYMYIHASCYRFVSYDVRYRR